VTAYGRQRERDLTYQGTERLGVFTHEVRGLLNTAVLSFDVIKKGMVGLSGSTGAIHARSLAGLAALVERSLAEVRLAAGAPRLERVLVGEFMEEIEVSALMLAEGHGLALEVSSADPDVVIDADRQLLASAVSNLLQNAFKFSKPKGTVTLTTRATKDRVSIDVSDQCGGLPPGKVDELFRPFTRGSSDRTGLGLGLSIALSSTRANSGELYVTDVPGIGCVFTIDLPRRSPLPRSLFKGKPEGEPGSLDDSTEGREGDGAHSGEPRARAV
jgi:signal transduction histidine kinase